MIAYLFAIGWSLGQIVYLLLNYKRLIIEKKYYLLILYVITDIVGLFSICSVRILGIFFILFAIQSIELNSNAEDDSFLDIKIYGIAICLLIGGFFMLLFNPDI